MSEPVAERSTKQKRAIAQLLAATPEFRSAQSLHALLRDAGARVGLTTVYAQLRALADSGEVDTVRTDDGETLYRRCRSAEHHHHLVCRDCGAAVEIENPDLEVWTEKVSARSGYSQVEHTLDMVGTCRACSRRPHHEPVPSGTPN